MKRVTMLGARSRFVKASVVSVGLTKHSKIKEAVVNIGRHLDIDTSDMLLPCLA